MSILWAICSTSLKTTACSSDMDALAHLRPDGDERIFAARVLELAERALERDRPCFTAFLDERRQAIAAAALRHTCCGIGWQGGHDGAVRRVLGVLAGHILPDAKDYPIAAMTILFSREHPVSHRDILGALMSLRIKREAVGDILVGDCLAAVFLLQSVAPVVQSELTRVGGAGVRCTMGLPDVLPALRQTEERRGIVSALRLDCVSAMLTGESRTRAARLILSGQVQKNAQTVCRPDAPVCDQDVISVRGYGKYQIGPVGSRTGKGRLHVIFHKYS
jgi:RNA-binding protein YlmH